ncbi:Syntaxin 16 [Blattamonas nauphoetae]|uniref:Syntaxin 16 n=1 Tax=Blattamonas nauphoetae TaxID=2049346 RepID=A0ABQ9XQX6_9EUKA|nr:Syntaxin 16 [Blattamonas nauphoetae]
MAYRDLTPTFRTLRLKWFPNGPVLDDSDFGTSYGQSDATSANDNLLKAPFVLDGEKARQVLAQIGRQMEQLKKEYTGSLLIHEFDTNDSEEKTQVISDTITSLLTQASKLISKIFPKEYSALMSDTTLQLPSGETYSTLQIRKNLQTELNGELLSLSQTFRSTQREFMQKLQGRDQQAAKQSNQENIFDSFDEPEAYSIGFTREQEEQVQKNRTNVQERVSQIQAISRSIHQVQQMFQEMHILVVEQGTLIDRIDQNLMNTQAHVQEAMEQLTQAEKHQKSARFKTCILLLTVAVVVIVIVVIIIKMFT